MGYKHTLVASSHSLSEVDCMTNIVKLTDFCLKNSKNIKKLTRGYIDRLTDDAVCEYAESVKISISCDKRDQLLCVRKSKGCLKLKNIFAFSHELVHFSKNNNKLSCYFSYREDSLIDID